MRRQLKEARQMGFSVIAAGHYPLCTAHGTAFDGKEKAIELLEAYGVRLYMCGHLHKRCVTVSGGLNELVVDQTVAYPCCYAAVLSGDEVIYAPKRVDVSAWAEQYAKDDPHLLMFDEYQKNLEQERCRSPIFSA